MCKVTKFLLFNSVMVVGLLQAIELDNNILFFFNTPINAESILELKQELVKDVELCLHAQKMYSDAMETNKQTEHFKMYEDAKKKQEKKLEVMLPHLCEEYVEGYRKCQIEEPLLVDFFLERHQLNWVFNQQLVRASEETFYNYCLPVIQSEQILQIVRDSYASERLSLGNVWRSLKNWFRK